MRNKQFLKLTISAIIIIAFCSCDFVTWIMGTESDIIFITNNSKINIGYYVADGSLYGNFYPDSLPLTDSLVIRKMEPGTRKILLYNPCSTWKKYFEWLPYDTLSVYIFNSDSLECYPWNEIRDKYIIEKRYDLSLDDLKRMDFEIVY